MLRVGSVLADYGAIDCKLLVLGREFFLFTFREFKTKLWNADFHEQHLKI